MLGLHVRVYTPGKADTYSLTAPHTPRAPQESHAHLELRRDGCIQGDGLPLKKTLESRSCILHLSLAFFFLSTDLC